MSSSNRPSTLGKTTPHRIRAAGFNKWLDCPSVERFDRAQFVTEMKQSMIGIQNDQQTIEALLLEILADQMHDCIHAREQFAIDPESPYRIIYRILTKRCLHIASVINILGKGRAPKSWSN